jgi:hypothetical protein
MADKTNPDLDRKMLSLTQVSIFIGVLGIIVGAIIGILQLRGGSAPQPVKEKTVIIRERIVPSAQDATQQPTQSAGQTASHKAETNTPAVHESVNPPKTEPKTEPAKTEPQPAKTKEPPTGGATPGNGGNTGTVTVPPLHRFPGGIHIFKPTPTSTSSTPVVRPGKFRLPVVKPSTPANSGP